MEDRRPTTMESEDWTRILASELALNVPTPCCHNEAASEKYRGNVL